MLLADVARTQGNVCMILFRTFLISIFLVISGYTASSLALGLVAVFGGALFLSAYLLVASLRSKGDIRTLLLGEVERIR